MDPQANGIAQSQGMEAAKTEAAVTQTPPAQAGASADPAAAPTEPKKEPLSPQFSALARKEKAIRAQQEKLKAERAEIDAKLAKVKEWEEISDPIKALQLKGWTYEDATNYVLSNGKPTPEREVKQVRKELEQIRKEQAEKEQRAAESEKARLQQELEASERQVKTQITEFVASHADEYELINLYGQSKAVYELIAAKWGKDLEEYNAAKEEDPDTQAPKVLSYKEAADMVEKQLEAEVDRALKSKKIAAKLAPKKEEPKKEEPKSATTLTNDHSAGMTAFTSAKTEAERMKRALAALG